MSWPEWSTASLLFIFWTDSPESDTLAGLDFWLFSMFSHLASPSLAPFLGYYFLYIGILPPFGLKCRATSAAIESLASRYLSTKMGGNPLFRGRCWLGTCLSPSWSIVCTSNRWSWLCVGLCRFVFLACCFFPFFVLFFGSEIEQSKIFVGLGWDLDLLLVGWRWFMANNLSNFILFYISGCLYGNGLNVMSTVLHVIWIEGWGMAVPVTWPPSFELYRKWLANRKSYLPWYVAEKVKWDLMEIYRETSDSSD